ncbi:MAG: TRAP transporter TatT component family protein [Polyangiales bacterium]
MKKTFKKKSDAEALLWTGQAWGAFINMNMEDMATIADVPFAKAMVERSVELDPSFFFSSGKMLLGTIASQELGGDMENSKRLFEEALAQTERRNLLIQLNMARYYAVQMGDQKLFRDLLEEVVKAGDVLPESRLSNVIARRRAERYLGQGSLFFSDYGS